MIQVLVVYYSQQGSTRDMAVEIAAGIENVVGCEAVIRTVPSVSSEVESISTSIPESGDPYVELSDLKDCSGLALGSPTRFGNMASAMKYFLDSTSSIWLGGELEGKPASVFTSTSSLHGGQESTLLTMMVPLLHLGMVISGVPYSVAAMANTKSGGTPYGASHWNPAEKAVVLSDEEKKICQAQGKRLAQLAIKLSD